MESHPPFQYVPGPAIRSFGTTVFAEFGMLAAKHNSVNLAQGAPDFDAPDFVLQAAHAALGKKQNQYSRPAGSIPIINSLAKLYSPSLGRTVDPMSEVIVTVGASEAIFASVQSLVGPGDEVVMVEPVFDPIKAAVIMCGAIPKYIPLRARPDTKQETLHSDNLYIDRNELAGLINDNTKLLIINSPHNPTGKVFSKAELEEVAAIVRQHSKLCVISDEVYEFLTFDNAVHEKFANLPGMWERTLTLGSASKTFSITGWRVGWAVGPKDLIQGVFQDIPFCTCSVTQDAVAQAFEEAPQHDYYPFLKDLYQKKRDHLVESLEAAGLRPIVPKGSYFVVADITQIVVPETENLLHQVDHRHDYNVCRYLTSVVGVAALPMSAFYSEENKHIGEKYPVVLYCSLETLTMKDMQDLHFVKQMKY